MPLVSPALLHPALTNMWYVHAAEKVYAVCAAHSLVTLRGARCDWRIAQMKQFVASQNLDFRIMASHVREPWSATDFAVAEVGTLPEGAVALALATQPLDHALTVSFVFSHRFDYHGSRIKPADISLGVHETTAIPQTDGLLRVHDTGFPGFSGAACLTVGAERFAPPTFRGLFVGTADPALPKGMLPASASHAAPGQGALRGGVTGCRPGYERVPPVRRTHGRLARWTRSFLGIDVLDQMQVQLSALDQMQADMLTKRDIKPLIRATMRRWGACVDAAEIHKACTEGDMVSIKSLIGHEASPAWRAFEAHWAESDLDAL